MSIKPLDDRVVVKPAEAETQTASGLYLPESAADKPVQGKVVAVGPGRRLKSGERAPMNVKKGDSVVYGRFAGTEVELKGKDHLIMRETELLGVLGG